MDHIPVGEIDSQLPMFIDPTMIVDNVLAGYWDAADALGNSPNVGDPEGLWERNAMALLMAAFTEGDRRNRALGDCPRQRLLGVRLRDISAEAQPFAGGLVGHTDAVAA
jgi:hypothetical protein